ncbi:MAG: hypothetical protein ACLRVD_07755 [Blautia caecimuris]
MCNIGDIILINNYNDNGKILHRHSFVVIDDEGGEIMGLPYDFVANVLSSFKDNIQRQRKLSYDGNFPISHNDTETNPHNNKDGYVKTDQLYYFNKNKISYTVIGFMKPEIFNMVLEFIEDSDFELSAIIDNL